MRQRKTRRLQYPEQKSSNNADVSQAFIERIATTAFVPHQVCESTSP
jgi:hypothetical protein